MNEWLGKIGAPAAGAILGGLERRGVEAECRLPLLRGQENAAGGGSFGDGDPLDLFHGVTEQIDGKTEILKVVGIFQRTIEDSRARIPEKNEEIGVAAGNGPPFGQ